MMELHGKGWGANMRPTLFRCSSSARTASEASMKGEDEVLRSTACQYWDVVPPIGLPTKQAQGAKLN